MQLVKGQTIPRISFFAPTFKSCSRILDDSAFFRRHVSSASFTRPKKPLQRSMKIAMQEQLKESGMPNDLGLLEGSLQHSHHASVWLTTVRIFRNAHWSQEAILISHAT